MWRNGKWSHDQTPPVWAFPCLPKAKPGVPTKHGTLRSRYELPHCALNAGARKPALKVTRRAEVAAPPPRGPRSGQVRAHFGPSRGPVDPPPDRAGRRNAVAGREMHRVVRVEALDARAVPQPRNARILKHGAPAAPVDELDLRAR